MKGQETAAKDPLNPLPTIVSGVSWKIHNHYAGTVNEQGNGPINGRVGLVVQTPTTCVIEHPSGGRAEEVSQRLLKLPWKSEKKDSQGQAGKCQEEGS